MPSWGPFQAAQRHTNCRWLGAWLQITLPMEQDWQRSMRPASILMNIALAEGVIDPSKYLWRRALEGRLQNRDTLIGQLSEYPVAIA
jgi:hypothetical protein